MVDFEVEVVGVLLQSEMVIGIALTSEKKVGAKRALYTCTMMMYLKQALLHLTCSFMFNCNRDFARALFQQSHDPC